MSDPHFERIALVGIGLINSSLAHVLRRDKLAGEIVACARSQASLDTATRLGLCDSATLDPAVAVKGADLVVLGTPLSAYAGGAPASRRSGRTSSARHVLKPALAPASRPAILRHRVPPWAAW